MRNVIVTGGSRGLGLAISKHLAASGYQVVATGRRESSELTAAIAEAGSAGQGAIAFMPLELADTQQIHAFVTGVRKQFGDIYGLVNNAGIGTDGLLANMHVDRISELVQVNILAPLVLTKYAVRSMMSKGEGRIVNLSSIVSFTGYSGLAAYAATKSSMIGFTRSLAREVGRLGITVNAVAPGFINTDLTNAMTEEDRNRVAGRSALRRLADAEDVAKTTAFLLGEGGRNITGTVITVDAGSTA